MKKIICLLIISALISSAVCFAREDEISDWAKEDYLYMETIGALGFCDDVVDFTMPITRLQFAELLYDTYSALTGTEYLPAGKAPFRDTLSPAAAAMYELDIAKGDNNKNFNPSASILREEASKMLYNFRLAVTGEELSDSGWQSWFYFDAPDISKWARTYIDSLSHHGVITGTDGYFYPKQTMTVEQAIVLCARTINLSPKEDAVFPSLPKLTEGDKITVDLSALPDSEEYLVNIVTWRSSIHSEEMGHLEPVTYSLAGNAKEFTFNVKPVRRYVVTVTNGEEGMRQIIDIAPVQSFSENLAEIEAYGLPQSAEEAEALMENITVNIWKIKNGKKVADTASLTVHKAIAEKVVNIFQEIFEGEEQFPISSLGAYAWRGGKSEHNYGTAIDINANENYCIYTNGTVVGSFYKPYVSPYSIKPFGEVVEIFEKYGFNWGGDTWRGNRDYMHFSYCGT